MAEQLPSLARINFSPDQLNYDGTESVAADFIRCLQTEGTGRYLAALHKQREFNPIHREFAAVREDFDVVYGSDPEKRHFGEAFEDGALIATILGDLHYKELIPALTKSIDDKIKDIEKHYGIFSGQKRQFVDQVRKEGAQHYLRFAKVMYPLIRYVHDDKYGVDAEMAALAEGTSFVLGRLQAAHLQDYEDFRIDVEALDLTPQKDENWMRVIGGEIIKLMDRQNSGYENRGEGAAA